MSERPLKSVKKFFSLLFSGKISDAERSLEYIKKKIGEDDYYKALYGIYYSYINDDRDSYVFKMWEKYLDGIDKKTLYNEIKRFMGELYDPPSRFLQAWLDLISMIDQLPKPHKIQKKVEEPASHEDLEEIIEEE
ncbi:MAG: hypothetical protein NZ929_00140 [Aigarchaeota archaeon]|nr:hypothetical protein [Aigarchaeota archaeon]MCX8193122.1 hypothetical protein [Nitrososphaeria archaeon]MDW7986745.1 hypothetical protein [Nitrososphaerota archaeon]